MARPSYPQNNEGDDQMNKFQLVGGAHSEDDKKYARGDVFESPHPLHKMFGPKFKLLTDQEDIEDLRSKIRAEERAKLLRESETGSGTSEEEYVLSGELANAQIVKRKGGFFDVLDENGEKLNEKGLRRKQVQPFIDQFTGA